MFILEEEQIKISNQESFKLNTYPGLDQSLMSAYLILDKRKYLISGFANHSTAPSPLHQDSRFNIGIGHGDWTIFAHAHMYALGQLI